MIYADDYARAYAEKYGMTIKDATELCEQHWDFLRHMLYERKEDVVIYRLGSFKQKTFKPKRVRIPNTDEYVIAPEKQVVKFTQSDKTIERKRDRTFKK